MPRKPSRDRERQNDAVQHAKMLEVLGLFRIVFKAIRRHYQSVERRAGISGAQLWALAQIADNPGLLAGDLARALAIHQSTASNLLRDLERSALVQRKRPREDQRSVRLFATSKGRAVLKRAPRPLIGVLQKALSDLPADNLDALHAELSRLMATIQTEISDARAMPLSEL